MANENSTAATHANNAISTYTLRKLIGILGISMPFVLLIFHPLLLSLNTVPISTEDPYRFYHGKEMITSTSGSLFADVAALNDSELRMIPKQLTSISNYHGFYMRDFFVAILCILAAFLFTYLGNGGADLWLSNLCGILAVGTAFLPCHVEKYSALHYISAAGLFVVFMLFCFFIFPKQSPKITDKENPDYYINRAQRNTYYFCGIIILACLIICLFVFFQNEDTWYHKSSLVFWVETVMLIAFGSSWLTSGETLKKQIGGFFVPSRLRHKRR